MMSADDHRIASLIR